MDCITAGFPCQPFSVAGLQQGVDDPRHLWPEVERIIGEVRPEWVFLENVPGLLSTRTPDGRRAIELVLEGLGRMGYRVEAGLFSAAEVGAPHTRERLFILAYRDDGRWGGKQVSGVFNRIGEARGHDADGRHAPVAHAIRERGCSGTTGSKHATDAFPPGPRGNWTEVPRWLWPALSESEVRGVAHGSSPVLGLTRQQQLRALGNAVVPAVAAKAWEVLMNRFEVEA